MNTRNAVRLLGPVLFLSSLLSLAWLAIPMGRADEKGEETKKDETKKLERKSPTPKLPSDSELMKAKLKASHMILEGLALNDFKKLENAGREIVKITNAAEFLNAYKSKEYELQMLTLRREADSLSKKASEKNIEGATLAYIGITMTCVKCHQLTRDEPDAVVPFEGKHSE